MPSLGAWTFLVTVGAAAGAERVAVLFGLDGQVGPGGDDIQSAETAVVALGGALSRVGFDVGVHTGADVSLNGIEAVLSAQKLGPDDTLLVYVATHGATCPLRDRRRWVQYLRVVGTVPTATCWEDALTDETLFTWAEQSGAGNVVLGVDACMTEVGVKRAGAGADLIPPQTDDRSRQTLVLRSTSPGRPAYEVDGELLYTGAFRHGIETGEADLDCDGAVTALEAHDYAATRAHVVTSGLDAPVVALKQHIALGVSRDIVLAGEVGAPQCSVLHDLPPQVGWALGEASEYLGLGPSGSVKVPADGRGPLVLERVPELGAEGGTSSPPRVPALRVRGVPYDKPTELDVGPWMPGRARGLPTVTVYGLANVSQAEGALVGGGLVVREQVVPEWSVSADVGGQAARAAAHLETGLNYHFRRWTAEGVGRLGAVTQQGAWAASAGIGGHLRMGLGRTMAADWAVIHDYVGASGGQTQLRLGVMWDPGSQLAYNRATSQAQSSGDSLRPQLLAAAATSAMVSMTSYAMARQSFDAFHDPATRPGELSELQSRTNSLYVTSLASGGLALGLLGGVGYSAVF